MAVDNHSTWSGTLTSTRPPVVRLIGRSTVL